MRITLLITVMFCTCIAKHVNAQQEDIFFTQLKAIFEANKSTFNTCTGKSISQAEDEETFECTLKLEGFITTIIKSEFDVTFVATSSNYALAETNMKKLLNKTTRENEGIIGYVNIDDKEEKPTLYKEFMTVTSLYNSSPNSRYIQISERPSRLGFVLKVN